MIIGTGVDIIEIQRIERLLRREPFPAKIYADAELESCRREGFGEKRRTSRLAGLFAAKEAVMKALGVGWTQGASWKEIVISHTEAGQPEVKLSGRTEGIASAIGAARILLSISHCEHYAIAFVVLEGPSL